MPLSPELRTIPGIIEKFNKSGLTLELISALLKRNSSRDSISDAKRLVSEFDKINFTQIKGLANIPLDSGALIAFNHPNIDILLPALLKIFIKCYERNNADCKLLLASEFPLTITNGKSIPVPGSIALIESFINLYPGNIIPVPMSQSRKDYMSGRFLAIRKAITALKSGDIVLVSPEGYVETDNKILPMDIFHPGAGSLGLIASKINIPIVPVGIWEDYDLKTINVNIGNAFRLDSVNEKEAAIIEMQQISQVLPQNLRGPFS